MMMLSEVALAVNGTLRGVDTLIESVDTDSRRIEKNQLFVAIKGERFDGNQFAEDAIAQGAAAALISEESSQARPAVLVKDSRIALGHLAAFWRSKSKAPIAAITGSNGKTTTKEMLSAILAAAVADAHRIHATYGNLNNDIGLPLTLLKIREHHAYVVVEMGMNHLGEIAYLSHIAKPDVAVINNAGTAHIGELGSRENIAKAKGEIFEGLSSSGIAVINADDDFADYWKSLNQHRKVVDFSLKRTADVTAQYQAYATYTQMHLSTPHGVVEFRLHVLGEHNVYNALAASAAAVAIGISNEHIAQGLSGFGGVYARLQQKQGVNGAVLIDDTYNANPDSMKAAINVLSQQPTTKVFVMGDMGELGEDAAAMHAEIGRYARERGIEHFIALGDLSQQACLAYGTSAKHFKELEQLASYVKSLMNDQVTVLVKGSRFMQMERVVKLIEQVPQSSPKQESEKV
ncbi:MAG: UDP-N-acetylmuramoyl-tripeptide--D-alanyl-D-alanine ligase [Methylophilus sp.]|nr:UDP-N-acetylmuramoyl-tripeptide--D-alanyl-D-alanine ligase [Methylophilus sp.]